MLYGFPDLDDVTASTVMTSNAGRDGTSRTPLRDYIMVPYIIYIFEVKRYLVAYFGYTRYPKIERPATWYQES